MKKIINCLVVALLPALSMAHAQNVTEDNHPMRTGAYLTDSAGNIVKSDFGLCWRTSSWTPATAVRECDPDLFKQEVTLTQTTTEVVQVVKTVEPVKQPVNVVIKTYFEFDRSNLTMDSRSKLNEVANKIKQYNVEVVTVSGHADRIGSEEYNEALSQRRADTVKAELVNLGVDESKIFTDAHGETEPEVNCPGKTSAKVISCLSPNRRVELEVVGSRQ